MLRLRLLLSMRAAADVAAAWLQAPLLQPQLLLEVAAAAMAAVQQQRALFGAASSAI
jgi:hypothetical protein